MVETSTNFTGTSAKSYKTEWRTCLGVFEAICIGATSTILGSFKIYFNALATNEISALITSMQMKEA